MNIRALMTYDLLTIIIDIQGNLNYLYFKAGLKRVTNCMRKHGIRANIRKKKHNRVKRHEEYINDNLLEDNLIDKDQMKFG
ncbi:hypothetical protein [Ligilactobacillus murinus]|uniref:hypothetical protein n=1 Tax=Ligilactobacillus murinus TaxID=1622 RepID=UPI001F033D52|nr:hypothetical protein [Ligilactobacillus murinus]